jgi:hypothetical protein
VNTILQSASAILYLLVGALSFVMAWKSMLSRKFLLFHEAAAGKPWESIDPGVQTIIITLLRISGLGFMAIGLLLTISAVVTYFSPNPVLKFVGPAISLLFCIGLCVINYQLHARTKTGTPWKGSLYAAIAVLAGIALSALH